MNNRFEWFSRFRGWFWSHQRPIRAIACFFVGHDVKYGDYRMCEPDWCARCWYASNEINLEEGWTAPRILNHLYCWLVDKHWHWFDRFDDWMCHNAKNLPQWWSY